MNEKLMRNSISSMEKFKDAQIIALRKEIDRLNSELTKLSTYATMSKSMSEIYSEFSNEGSNISYDILKTQKNE